MDLRAYLICVPSFPSHSKKTMEPTNLHLMSRCSTGDPGRRQQDEILLRFFLSPLSFYVMCSGWMTSLSVVVAWPRHSARNSLGSLFVGMRNEGTWNWTGNLTLSGAMLQLERRWNTRRSRWKRRRRRCRRHNAPERVCWINASGRRVNWWGRVVLVQAMQKRGNQSYSRGLDPFKKETRTRGLLTETLGRVWKLN